VPLAPEPEFVDVLPTPTESWMNITVLFELNG
jgi:hypothetical protein